MHHINAYGISLLEELASTAREKSHIGAFNEAQAKMPANFSGADRFSHSRTSVEIPARGTP